MGLAPVIEIESDYQKLTSRLCDVSTDISDYLENELFLLELQDQDSISENELFLLVINMAIKELEMIGLYFNDTEDILSNLVDSELVVILREVFDPSNFINMFSKLTPSEQTRIQETILNDDIDINDTDVINYTVEVLYDISPLNIPYETLVLNEDKFYNTNIFISCMQNLFDRVNLNENIDVNDSEFLITPKDTDIEGGLDDA